MPSIISGRPVEARTVAILQALSAGIGFGFVGIFGKKAYDAGFTPALLLTLRFVCSSILLFTGFLLFSPASLRLKKEDILKAAALGVLGYAVFASCYFEALQGLSASLTVLLLYTYPVVVVSAARLFLGERIGCRKFFCLSVALFGLLFLLWGEMKVRQSVSLLYGLGSSIFYAFYILASGQLLKGVKSMSAGFYVQLSAAIALALFHLHQPGHALTLFEAAWPWVLGLALISTALPVTLFLASLKKLTTTEVAILSTAEPITAVLAAYLLLDEKMSAIQLFGGAMVLMGLVLISFKDFTPFLRQKNR
jgi:drug/metabolite transporter, DME family